MGEPEFLCQPLEKDIGRLIWPFKYMAPDRIKPRKIGENRATESPFSAAYGYNQIPIERRLLQADASDRDGQFALYRQIPSLGEYPPVSQSRIQAELYTRGAETGGP